MYVCNTYVYIFSLYISRHYVCVCEREREREREILH
jgi:hypothetical protein